MKRNHGPFETWFALQCGARTKFPDLTDADLEGRVNDGKAAEAEMQRRLSWDRARTAALYAWAMTEKDKASYATHPALPLASASPDHDGGDQHEHGDA